MVESERDLGACGAGVFIAGQHAATLAIQLADEAVQGIKNDMHANAMGCPHMLRVAVDERDLGRCLNTDIRQQGTRDTNALRSAFFPYLHGTRRFSDLP